MLEMIMLIILMFFIVLGIMAVMYLVVLGLIIHFVVSVLTWVISRITNKDYDDVLPGMILIGIIAFVIISARFLWYMW